MNSSKARRVWIHLGCSIVFFALLAASAAAEGPIDRRLAAGPDWGAPGGVIAPARPSKLQAVEPKTAPAAAETVLKTQRFTLDGKHSTESVPFQVPGPGKVILEVTGLYPLNMLGLVARGADPKVTVLRKDGPTPLRLEFTVTAQTLANWSVPTKPAPAGAPAGATPPVTTAPQGYTWKVDATILGTNGMIYGIPGSATVVDLKVSFVPDAPARKTALEPKANPNLGAATQSKSGMATGKSGPAQVTPGIMTFGGTQTLMTATAAKAAQPAQAAGNPALKTSPLSPPIKTAPGLTPVPAKSGSAAIATWDVLWRDIWKKTGAAYRIEAGPTVKQEKACQGNLGLDTLVENYVRAIQLKKYGDAVRWMAQFQDRSLCLTREGVRGVEFALSAFVHQAITRLPPNEAQTAVQGVFNLGTITFDQIQYTGRSYWLPMVSYHNKKIQSLMSTYPRNDLGLWVYDFNGGNLVRPSSPDSLDRLMTAMQRFDNFGTGTCNLLDMSQSGFLCQSSGKTGRGASSGGGGQGSGMASGPGTGSSQASAGCIVNAARSSGGREMLACAGKALAGLRPDVNDRPTDPGTSIVDKSCALREEAGGAPVDTEAEKKEPTKWERVKDAASTAYDAGSSATLTGVGRTVKDITVSVFMAVFDLTPPVASELAQGASPAGADAVRGTLQAGQEFAARNLLDGTDKGNEAYFKARESRVTTEPTAYQDKRTAPEGGERGGGGCGNASNAARRAQALYDCYQGGGPAAAGGGSPRPGGIDPTIALTTEPQMGGRAAGMLACLTQGGSMVRNGIGDRKCAAMRCVPGEPCPCEPGGAGSQAGMEGGGKASTPKAGPDCIDGPCGPGVAPPGIGGGAPPGTGGGAPPGGGPRPPGPGPSPGFVPPTKGAIPVSPLQQIGR